MMSIDCNGYALQHVTDNFIFLKMCQMFLLLEDVPIWFTFWHFSRTLDHYLESDNDNTVLANPELEPRTPNTCQM